MTNQPNLPTVEIVDVSPELAETWLALNANNRNVRRAAIDAYARDMRAGRWLVNGETVKFDLTGALRDGQHRLSAVVAAETTVAMVVVRGLAPDVMPTVDAGAKRTYSDTLKLQGEDNTSTLAAVTRRALMWSRGQRTNTGRVTPTPLEMNAYLAENPRLRTSAEVAAHLASRALLPASIFGLCHFLFSDLDPDAAEWFLGRLADGDGLSVDDPIAVLRGRIVKMRVGGRRVNETDALALTIHAWNAHRAGETRTQLRLPKGGLTPENYPEPR